MGMEIEWEVAESCCPTCSAARPRRLRLAGSGNKAAAARRRTTDGGGSVCATAFASNETGATAAAV